ncbi:uncharacterized protein [Lolium perenne]|uniref:uncharacterized protein n=1 Tax=Lolium perenne TaxID=4522 RepID=UPI003A98F267
MSGDRRTAPTPPPLNQQRTSQTPPPADQRRRSLSRGRSRARHGGGEVVVQREVIREVGGGGGSGAGLVFPMLKRGGYTNWAMVMEVNMQAASLWDAIEDVAISRREDKQALAALLRSTPEEMHPMLISKGSARAAWEAIRVQHQGTDRVRDTRVRRLRTEFETISFNQGERVEDFGLRISNLAATMRSLGDACDEEKVVRKFLSVVPKSFVQIAFSMETLMDPATLTVEEVVGHLRAVEERLEGDQTDSGGQLLLTEQQWEEKRKQNRSGGRDRGVNNAPRKTGSPQTKTPVQGGEAADEDRDKCRYCKKKGHWARDCRKKKRDEAAKAAHLVQEDDGDHSVFMATVIELDSAVTEVVASGKAVVPAATAVAAAPMGEQVFLNEERARVELRRDSGDLDASWYLDTGASNHMTGEEDVFSELDKRITGKVRFGDGSVVDIHGRGTVLFAIDDERHRALTAVYWIPKLKSNIVSIG